MNFEKQSTFRNTTPYFVFGHWLLGFILVVIFLNSDNSNFDWLFFGGSVSFIAVILFLFSYPFYLLFSFIHAFEKPPSNPLKLVHPSFLEIQMHAYYLFVFISYTSFKPLIIIHITLIICHLKNLQIFKNQSHENK